MLIYWVLFGACAIAALLEGAQSSQARRASLLGMAVAYIALALLIGLRRDVGGDWYNYLVNYRLISGRPLDQILQWGDPGYQFVSWIAMQMGWGVAGLNVICALIFTVGLVAFSLMQPRPWLALLVSIPYLVIVVAMGYTRQGVAIGLAMMGLVALSRRSNVGFVVWVALAALFHKSAIILLPIPVIATTRQRAWTALWVGIAVLEMYYLFVAASYESLYVNYIQAQYQSQGATIRILMNALPAIVFLIFRKRFPLSDAERVVWTWIAVAAVLFVPLLMYSPSSTAVDRIGLYFIPLQLFVFSRLPDIPRENAKAGRALGFGVIAYYGAVQFTWMNYAVNARGWIPYNSYLF